MKETLQSRASWQQVLRVGLVQVLALVLCSSRMVAHDLGAQVLDKIVTLQVEDQEMTAALRRLETQTNIKFVFSPQVIKADQKVTFNVEKERFGTLLEKLLRPLHIKYEVSGKYILLSTEQAAKPTGSGIKSLETLVQPPVDVAIKGKVTDEKGEGLPGVSVIIKGSLQGTNTNVEGNYTIQVPDAATVLVFSSVGYLTKEEVVGNRTTLDVLLQVDTKALEEVVVVGYGTQKKANLTGAVDQIGKEVFENRPLPNLTQGLQGVLPNVNIRLLDGKPTQSPSINVRGTTSIGQGGSALILIDGVEGDPSMINPNDIETVTVLKDAASAAVYGARGAFGVVLITTKQPAKDAFSVTYNANFGSKQPTVLPNYVTDGFLWASMYNQSFYAWENTYPQNVNKTLTFSQEYLAELERRSKDPSLPKTDIGPDGKYVYYENTDWFKLLYKDRLSSREHNVSLSRSTDKANFMISGRYNGQDGLFRYNSDDFRVYNLRAKGAIKLYRWLEVNNNFDYSNRTYYNPLNVGEGSGIWRNIADEGHVLAPMLNPDGTITHSGAYTVGDFYYGRNGIDTERSIIRNTTGFEARFLENSLRVIGNFTFQNIYNDESRRRVQVPFSREPGVIEYLGIQYNDLREYHNRTKYLASNLYAEYEKTFSSKHYFKAMVGTNYEQSVYNRLEVQRNGLIFEDATNINLALGQAITTSGNYEGWKILGGFTRLNYIFNDKYLLEFNGRYDGSSKFPENERYAFFPSVSLGWRLSQEPFWPVSDKIVSDLKFRGSYGSLGNGNIGSYAFQETFSISQTSRVLDGIQPQRTSRPSVLPDGLTWETATTSNVGMDLAMFSGKLQLNADAYIRKTTDMYTIGLTLPATFGATSPRGNYADLKTTGWELIVAWRDNFSLASKAFNYRIGVNLADNQSVILRYNNPNRFLNDYYVGQKIGEMWGYVTEGFFTSKAEIDAHAKQNLFLSTARGEILPGDIKLSDLNNDGSITPGDNTVDNPGDRRIIGNSSPRYTFGVNVGADWKGFFFTAFFQGVGKQDWYPSTEANTFWGMYNRPYGDIPQWHLKEGIIWSEENPDSFFPRYVSRLANRSGGILTVRQTKYTMNAAYVRLKNFQVGYNIPKQLLAKTKVMNAARVFFSADNLWTWSPLLRIVTNVDVENANAPSDQLFTDGNAGDGYNYPMLRTLTLGFSVTF
ncbi:TonB-dependent receptor [Rhabdobacter roseus]|uniref:TonB-linked SusC/RagA family outer membrane protein n=1 Tax=Rhabdobacter roseus TaxID=1655419 RepID=A0A840TWN3_9BACT|nr:TonB-dependent receptor [Rhabdobacter roseus]MBB5285673.1 TonB-linked SusC/RagA family outer membrane protein [Rhabdobacter roseus]